MSGGLYEITDLKGFLDALGAHLKPMFAEQHEVWEREGPPAEARAAEMGITIACIGGNCPVQAEGTFDGHEFYFRARGDAWSVDIGPEETWHGNGCWSTGGTYGSGFDAGWMHRHEALGFICQAVDTYRTHAAIKGVRIKP